MEVPLAARARGAGDVDMESYLPWLAELGYTGVEVGMGVFEDGPSPDEFRRIADEVGLAVTTFMGARHLLRDELATVAGHCEALSCRYVVQAWGPVEDLNQLRQDAAEYERTGALYAEQGLQFCYHNHDHELATEFGDRCALEVLLEETSPENFKLQLDLGWVLYGGRDPARFLRDNAGRCPVTHLRDVRDLQERGDWAPIGEGLLDIEQIVTAAVESGAEWVILEQKALGDLSREEGIEACAAYMRGLGILQSG